MSEMTFQKKSWGRDDEVVQRKDSEVLPHETVQMYMFGNVGILELATPRAFVSRLSNQLIGK
jgi:hypothetical protein